MTGDGRRVGGRESDGTGPWSLAGWMASIWKCMPKWFDQGILLGSIQLENEGGVHKWTFLARLFAIKGHCLKGREGWIRRIQDFLVGVTTSNCKNKRFQGCLLRFQTGLFREGPKNWNYWWQSPVLIYQYVCANSSPFTGKDPKIRNPWARTGATAEADYHRKMNSKSTSGSDGRYHTKLITDLNGNTSWNLLEKAAFWEVDCGVTKTFINVVFVLVLCNSTTAFRSLFTMHNPHDGLDGNYRHVVVGSFVS